MNSVQSGLVTPSTLGAPGYHINSPVSKKVFAYFIEIIASSNNVNTLPCGVEKLALKIKNKPKEIADPANRFTVEILANKDRIMESFLKPSPYQA